MSRNGSLVSNSGCARRRCEADANRQDGGAGFLGPAAAGERQGSRGPAPSPRTGPATACQPAGAATRRTGMWRTCSTSAPPPEANTMPEAHSNQPEPQAACARNEPSSQRPKPTSDNTTPTHNASPSTKPTPPTNPATGHKHGDSLDLNLRHVHVARVRDVHDLGHRHVADDLPHSLLTNARQGREPETQLGASSRQGPGPGQPGSHRAKMGGEVHSGEY